MSVIVWYRGMLPTMRRDAAASLLPLGVHRLGRDGLRPAPRPAEEAAPPAPRQPRLPGPLPVSGGASGLIDIYNGEEKEVPPVEAEEGQEAKSPMIRCTTRVSQG